MPVPNGAGGPKTEEGKEVVRCREAGDRPGGRHPREPLAQDFV